MNLNTIRVTSIENATHNVLRIAAEKPHNYYFEPGQATDVSINKQGWKDEKRPFTFTSLPTYSHLEFTIKIYPSHKGVTNELLNLKTGDELIIGDAWGSINYMGEGLFIAGGAGVTPFISILRNLHTLNKMGSNKLIFANDKEVDIINKEEFENILSNNFINILSQEKFGQYEHGFITEGILKKYVSGFNQYIYLCGPPSMVEAVEKLLTNLNVPSEAIIKEK